MAKAKSTGAKRGAKKGKKQRKGKRSFKTYISRVNKAAKRGQTLSSKAVKIVNSLCLDQFDRIATQAAALCRANGTRTIRAAEIQTAVRLSFPSELAKHAISEASKAVTTASK